MASARCGGCAGAVALAVAVAALLAAASAATARAGDQDAALRDDVRALQAQVAALLQRRSEDFKLLEESLRGSLEKSLELSTLRGEVDTLRQEVDRLRGSTRQRNDHVTLQWLSSAVTELRAELSEVAAARNASAELQRRQQTDSALQLLRTDVTALRKELEQLHAQGQRDAVAAETLRADLATAQQRAQSASAQCSDTKAQLETAVNDWMSSMKALRKTVMSKKHVKEMLSDEPHHPTTHHRAHRRAHTNIESNEVVPSAAPATTATSSSDGHRLRHQLRRQADASARRVERLAARVTVLERAGASRAAALDKLHLSALQLLESVETLESKVDRALPDVQREVSKVEVGVAQLQSAVQVLQEDQDNQRMSVKALAGGQSALQDKLDVDHARLGALQAQMLNLTLGANGTAGEGTLAGAAADDLSPGEEELQTRLDVVEQRLHRLQMVPAAEAAWVPDAEANITVTDALNSSDGAVPSLVRQLARVQSEYQRIVSRLPPDCSDVAGPSGLYLVAPGGRGTPIVTACDQITEGGGWTLVQRRTDGSQDFNRKWVEYADGFGSPAGEFWLGNEALHRLTTDNCSSLRIDLRDIYGKVWVAEYSEFSVGPESDGYRLHVAGYRGNASDALDYQNRMQFSAIDADRDISNTHCAANYEGGWWFSHCQHANLNGRYNLGLTWFDAAKNEWIAVAWSEMKVRRREKCS